MKKATSRSFSTRAGLAVLLVLGLPAVQAQTAPATKGPVSMRPVTSGPTDLATVGQSMDLVIGKSTLMRLPGPVERISVGNPSVADVTLISPTELYVLGKTYGSTNMILWRKGGAATAVDVNVNIDHVRMERKLNELMPDEKNLKVVPAGDSVILTGVVSSALKAKYAEDVANAYVRDVNRSLTLPSAAQTTQGPQANQAGTFATARTGGAGGAATMARVVNLLQVAEGQQVMLEVTIAEVSKTLMDKLGSTFKGTRTNGNWAFGLLSNLSKGGAGLLSAIKGTNGDGITLDAEKNDGLVKVLAEPNIVSISGQEASFLAGGKIFIPVARANATIGGSTITLEEKEFGVGLKFTPTVLEGGRIHLKVAPEVSELSQTGSPFTTIGGETAVLPSFTTRKVQTSVQLVDGQSLAIAGLIKNNVKQAVDRIPGLGELPVMGALFKSSEFQGDRSELMFVITPRLVKPLDANYILPTDGFVPPSRGEFYFGNKLEGSGHQEVPPDRPAPVQPVATSPAPAAGGMEVK